jgi:SAM-dependent methyltransferase
MADETTISITRGSDRFEITPSEYDRFEFQSGDSIVVVTADPGPRRTPDGCLHLRTETGESVRVPPRRYDLFDYRGFRIPTHLIVLTGAGPDTWEAIGLAHLANYARVMGLDPAMTFLEIGCGVGRDAIQLIDVIGATGRYVGTDVTRDSVVWCQQHISLDHPNFEFHHVDAYHELYNPLGTRTSLDFALPVEDGSVDRIALGSVFTHLFEDEVSHYLREIRRVLNPDGLAYATFFLYSAETIAAARRTDLTPFKLRFEHPRGTGCYVNDAAYPTGAVAYTETAMLQMIAQAGLRLERPFLPGWWSGAFAEPVDGQEVAVLARL